MSRCPASAMVRGLAKRCTRHVGHVEEKHVWVESPDVPDHLPQIVLWEGQHCETPEVYDYARHGNVALPDPTVATPGKTHRASKPTERAAATKVWPRTGSQRALILAALERAMDGLTDEEIAVVPGVADTAHRTRRSELVAMGWVRDSGRTRATESGSPSIVWELTYEGQREWNGAYHRGWRP